MSKIPVEKPDFIGTRKTAQERSLFCGNVAFLVSFPSEIPFFFVSVSDSIAVNSTFHINVNAAKKLILGSKQLEKGIN